MARPDVVTVTRDVLVDARNVIRSRWPNIPEAELVELAGRWAAARGVRVHLVFDGQAPGDLVGERAVDSQLRLIGTGAESADDVIDRIAERWRAEGRPYLLVTSDRELRRRAGEGAEATGGGSFADQLLAQRAR